MPFGNYNNPGSRDFDERGNGNNVGLFLCLSLRKVFQHRQKICHFQKEVIRILKIFTCFLDEGPRHRRAKVLRPTNSPCRPEFLQSTAAAKSARELSDVGKFGESTPDRQGP